MRVLKEVSTPEFKITFFAWNNRYLVKLEQGLLEQTFKISELDVENEEELLRMVDDEFLRQAAQRFAEMSRSLYEAKARAESR